MSDVVGIGSVCMAAFYMGKRQLAKIVTYCVERIA